MSLIFQGFVQKPLIGIDWKRFPKELAPSSARNKTKRKGGASSTLKPNLLSPKKKSKTLTIHPDDVLDKLEKAEKNGTKEGGDVNEGSDAEGKQYLILPNISQKNEIQNSNTTGFYIKNLFKLSASLRSKILNEWWKKYKLFWTSFRQFF